MIDSVYLAPQNFENALSWIESKIPYFAIEAHSETPRVLNLLKPLGELVLMASILKAAIGQSETRRLDHLVEFAWHQLREGSLFYEILVERPDMLLFSGLYATFKGQGFENKLVEDELTKIVRNPGYYHIEMAPWRRLDLLAGYRALGLVTDADLRETFSQTWLDKTPSPWTITPSTAYGVTHTVFYMTDYGRENLFDERINNYLRLTLPVWFQYYVAERNFDLASEFLMCINFLGLNDPPIDSLKELLCAQKPDGSVTGPAGGAINLIYEETDDKKICFLKDYHTTIVYTAAMSRFVGGRWQRTTT
ncbi:hypothetical protein G6M02_14105 [Agrobacterium rhizogenes]|nr:hypothetical protein [Rhizobium rhizogenes]